jgi:hypothetical protein
MRSQIANAVSVQLQLPDVEAIVAQLVLRCKPHGHLLQSQVSDEWER